MAEQQESKERLARPLIQLAQAYGVATSYIDQSGNFVEITDTVITQVLQALGIAANDDKEIAASLEQYNRESSSRLIAPTIVHFQGKDQQIQIHTKNTEIKATLTLEDGTSISLKCHVNSDGNEDHELSLTFPADLPVGYHKLTVDDSNNNCNATVLCAPERIELPEFLQKRQQWGWMTQFYSVRSKQSWGVGDYADLNTLVNDSSKSGADFMLINPIHANAPCSPLEPSPYLPQSRRFLNYTYIRPQNIAEYAELTADELAKVQAAHAAVEDSNDNPELIDLDESWKYKRTALEVIFNHPRSAQREAEFKNFITQAGEDLTAFATWSVAFEVWGTPWEEDVTWFETMRPDSPEIIKLREDHKDLLTFYYWLQWIAQEQLTKIQQDAKNNGMNIGVMQDMAVGIHAYAADVWWSPERFAQGASVGAPPDFYNQQGQNWSQPPFHPQYLENTGYKVYREMVHTMFAHAGAVRIDHILGLFRLWWIPANNSAKDGTYVYYNANAFIAILSIEASRANGIVIGEDLGTVPPYVSQVLGEHGILGVVVEWFTRQYDPEHHNPYADPETYRKYALASVTTHDMPPTAGYLEFEHVKIREELKLLTGTVEEFQKSAEDERRAMLNLLVKKHKITEEEAEHVSDNVQKIVEGMHSLLLESPSLLLQAALVDGTGERRAQNQPGTSGEQYPNWRIPLTNENKEIIHTEDVFKQERVLSLAKVMNKIHE
ncbi:MAG: 4-alpha-glucanotransferase [Bifidobacteriaceae bacterium]|nr:4-alpha-glucanotransferase [Bifidobacteriaceae bacterium]